MNDLATYHQFIAEKGGASAGRYAEGGTDAKSQMLADVHPDVARVVHKFGRTHHEVYYKGFRQKLKYKPGYVPPIEPNEYGMKLRTVEHYRMGY